MHKLRIGDTEATLAPLTILVGRNGAGKTSIIKACAASIRDVDWSNWPIDYPRDVECRIDTVSREPPALILDNSDRYHLLIKLANYYRGIAEEVVKELGICERLDNACLARMSFGYVSLALDALAIRYAEEHQTAAFIDYPEYGMHPQLIQRLVEYINEHRPPFLMMSTQSIDLLHGLAGDPSARLLVIHDGSIYSVLESYELADAVRHGIDLRGL